MRRRPWLVGLSLHPLGMGMADYVGPARDFAARGAGARRLVHPATRRPTRPVRVWSPAASNLTLGGLVDAAAAELAARLGIGAGDRVLVDEQVAAEAGPVAWLLAPLAAGASIVRRSVPQDLASRASGSG